MNRQDLPELPHTSGVYFFRDKHDNPLYIGKATNLHNRVSSYFNFKNKDKRIIEMVKNAESLSYINTDSDIEALILESVFIKKFDPKYNILLRDDKQYFFVYITDDTFPRIFLTHQPHKIANAQLIIGPFTSGLAIKSLLSSLKNIYHFCTCKNDHKRQCLNGAIGKCLGYCCNINDPLRENSAKKYKFIINKIIRILTGEDNDELRNIGSTQIEKNIRAINKVGGQVTTERKYIKDIEGLEELKNLLKLDAIPNRIECYDIAHIQGSHASGGMIVLQEGIPSNKDYRLFNIKESTTDNDPEMLSEVIKRRAKHNEWSKPDLIIVDGGTAQVNSLKDAIEGTPLAGTVIIGLTKNSYHKPSHITFADSSKLSLSKIPRSVVKILATADLESHRFTNKHYRNRHRKTLIK